MNMLLNLTKAAVSVAVAPVALVADICTLPSSGYNDTPPFARTGGLLSNAGACVREAVKPGGKDAHS